MQRAFVGENLSRMRAGALVICFEADASLVLWLLVIPPELSGLTLKQRFVGPTI